MGCILDIDAIHGCGDSRYALSSVLVSNHTRKGIQVHKQGAEAYLTAGIGIRVKEPWILRQRQDLELRQRDFGIGAIA
jgi:hypothetical protein